eukprot:scaffold327268_cov35-Attheya_sp.AAC.1
MRDEDPAPRPQMALPVDTIAAAAAAALQPLESPMAKATGDLITAALYFLLHVGEYTIPPVQIGEPNFDARMSACGATGNSFPTPPHSRYL